MSDRKLISERSAEEIKNPIDYFYNEKGDYTITLYDDPVAFTKNEDYAVRLKNSYSALTMRINVLSKMNASQFKKFSLLDESSSVASDSTEIDASFSEASKKLIENAPSKTYVLSEVKEWTPELEKLIEYASEVVKNDIVAAWASDEDRLIYEHFYIKGFEAAKEAKEPEPFFISGWRKKEGKENSLPRTDKNPV